MTPCPCSYCKEWRVKIETRILELQEELKAFNKNGKTLHVVELQYGIDELRKLVE